MWSHPGRISYYSGDETAANVVAFNGTSSIIGACGSADSATGNCTVFTLKSSSRMSSTQRSAFLKSRRWNGFWPGRGGSPIPHGDAATPVTETDG